MKRGLMGGLAAIVIAGAAGYGAGERTPEAPPCERVDISTFEVTPEQASLYPRDGPTVFVRASDNYRCWGLLSFNDIGGYAGYPPMVRISGDVPVEYAPAFSSAEDFVEYFSPPLQSE